MYICPSSGLLKVVRPRRSQVMPQRVAVGQLVQYHQRDGLWWELRLRAMGAKSEIHRRHSSRRSPPVPNRTWDVWLEEYLSPEAETVAYGGKFVAVSMRLLTPQETRALYRRLRNLSPRQRTRSLRFDSFS